MKDVKAGIKFDQKKRRFSLFPVVALKAIVDVLEYGAQKYEPDNWRKVPDARKRYYDAAMRHLTDWWGGETHDPESGLHHLAHLGCNAVFLLTFELEGYPK